MKLTQKRSSPSTNAAATYGVSLDRSLGTIALSMARCSRVGIANDNAVYANAQTRPSATDRHSPRHSVSSRRSVGHIGRSGGSTYDTPAKRLAERVRFRLRVAGSVAC